MKKVKYLIIGAGISGITVANYLKKDYLVIEKENSVGGYCKTIKKGDFIWDYAGHFFHFNTAEFKNKFLNLMPKDEIIYQEKCTKILRNNQLIDYPFQTNIHQLDKKEFIDCLFDLFNKKEKDNYTDFLDMLYGKFGKSIVDKFLKPYNEKLYACNLHNLDTDAMGRFFPYANLQEIINNMKESQAASYNNIFLYPKNGAGSFINCLYDKLEKEKVLLNETIISIDEKRKRVKTSLDEIIEYEYLINTIPLNNFLKLFNNRNYLTMSKELSYNKVLVFNLGFNKKSKFTKEHWMYIPDKDINFYRIGFYDNILNFHKLSMYIEIGFAKDENVAVEEQLELTLMNLKKLNIVTEDMILEAYSVIIMDPAYVHINSITDKKIKDQFQKFGKNNIYSIGRYGAWTYCSMEDSMIQAKELAEKINKNKEEK